MKNCNKISRIYPTTIAIDNSNKIPTTHTKRRIYERISQVVVVIGIQETCHVGSSNKIVVVVVITIVFIGMDKCAIGRRIGTRVVSLVSLLLGSFVAI